MFAHRILGVFIVSLLLAQPAPAQIVSATLDVLDGSDPGAPTPPGIIVLDGFVDVATTDTWVAAGIYCRPENGASFRYADGDANVPGVQPQVYNPGSGNDRFVTMISRPRPRNDSSRFDNCAAAVAGGNYGGPPGGTIHPQFLDIAYFASPPVTPQDPSVDGYVLRLALSAPGQTADTVILTNSDSPPDATHPLLLLLVGPNQGIGWVNATWDRPNPVGSRWFLWGIPEPSTAILFVLMFPLAARRAYFVLSPLK